MTTTSENGLPVNYLKELKLFAMNPIHLETIFEVSMSQLKLDNSQIRLSSFLLHCYLFPRSAAFRKLFHASYPEILALCVDRKCAPKPVFQTLRTTFRRQVLEWCDSFDSSHIGRLKNSVSYINAKLKISAEALKEEEKNRELKLRDQADALVAKGLVQLPSNSLGALKITEQFEIEVEERVAAINERLNAMSELISMLFPIFDEDPNEAEDGKEVSEGDNFDDLDWEEGDIQAESENAQNLDISFDENEEFETEDNLPIFESLRDELKYLKKQEDWVQRIIDVYNEEKYSVESSPLFKQLVDVSSQMARMVHQCATLRVTVVEKNGTANLDFCDQKHPEKGMNNMKPEKGILPEKAEDTKKRRLSSTTMNNNVSGELMEKRQKRSVNSNFYQRKITRERNKAIEDRREKKRIIKSFCQGSIY